MKRALFLILFLGLLFAKPEDGGAQNIEHAINQLESTLRDFMLVLILLLFALSFLLLAPGAWLYFKEPGGLDGKAEGERRIIIALVVSGSLAAGMGFFMLFAYVFLPNIIEHMTGFDEWTRISTRNS